MTAITFGYGWETWRLSTQGSWMTVQALNPQADVLVVRKLDWLGRGDLGLAGPEDRTTQQDHANNSQSDLDERLFK
jgi:hypothetical protein